MACSINDLFRKDVIDISSGSRIGSVYDIEIEQNTGELVAFVIECPEKQMSFRRSTIRICREDVVVIGKEAILVKNVELPEIKKESNKKFFDLFSK